MQFKTSQAQVAYGEVCAEYGRAVDEFLRTTDALVAQCPDDVVEIRLHAAMQVAAMRTKGIETAIRLATDVDVQWSSLAGHLVMAAQQ